MEVCAIVAVAQNNVIGQGNEMPWHLPEDLKHFKKVTMGSPVVMGRKTFESIGRPLPGRKNIVLTRDQNFQKEGIEVKHSPSEVLDYLKQSGVEKVFIIGGAEIYKLFSEEISRYFITRIELNVEGDTHLPEDLWRGFNQIDEKKGKSETPPFLKYRFQEYIRN